MWALDSENWYLIYFITNVELGGILGYPNFYSPVIVGPAKKRVVFAVSGNPSSVGSNIQLSLVALSLNNGRRLWTAEEPATSYYGMLLLDMFSKRF